MENTYIKIRRIPYEEPHSLELHWKTSNGVVSSKFELHCDVSLLSDIGSRLEEFPRHSSDVFLKEIGSEFREDRWGYYFRFRVFMTSPSKLAMQFRYNNNRELPDKQITEFCIQTEPAALNKLGRKFLEFSKLRTDTLYWSECD